MDEPRPAPTSKSPRPDGPRSLATPLERLPGVGTTRARRLGKLGLATVRDALLHFPREYRDFTGAHRVAELVEGEHASLSGRILEVAARTTARGRGMLTAVLAAGDGEVRCVWFNMPFMARRLPRGSRVAIAGQPRRSGLSWEFAHPEVRQLDPDAEDDQPEWLPIYPLSEGVQQWHVRTAVKAALGHAVDLLEEALPAELLLRKELLPIGKAIAEIHRPTTRQLADAARRRFVYQELLMLQLALRMHRRHQTDRGAAPLIDIDARLDHRIQAVFTFPFTAAQRRVCEELATDMRRPRPMNRLLQGDVGSGKTAVAFYAMLATAATPVADESPAAPHLAVQPGRPRRYQAALMAPTEILARQHHETLRSLLAARGSALEVALLVGGQTAATRRKLMASIAAGEIGLVVGTQALVCSEASFCDLGLVVIDEQHRFGVLQRALLRDRGVDPHTLVMTATPIPRTIAHTLYGELDISVLDEQPPGRQPVATYRVNAAETERWWDFFRRKLGEGRQGYVVVPAVEESKRELASVDGTFEQLANGPLEAFRLGLVHGRMKPAEKAAVMDDFRGGRLDVLVATSVIEVGIDVPRATLMTILDAEAFGLAQLHQLRGRVARGPVQGLCGAVVGGAAGSPPRIDAFVASTDGFSLAEQDLLLRGPGDLLGRRQSGAPPLFLADLLRDTAVVAEASRDATAMLAVDPELSAPALDRLRRLMLSRWGEAFGLGGVG